MKFALQISLVTSDENLVIRIYYMSLRYRINNRITAPKVRLIDEKDEHLGIVPIEEALNLAKEHGYDLVEISPKTNPPVAKLLDFGQFLYQQKKLLQKQKAKAKKTELKGIRLSFRIGKHDLDMRLKQGQKFLEEGHKIKIEMVLKGREKQHLDLAKEIINKFIQSLDENVIIEQPLSKQGGRLTTIVVKK